MTMTSIERVEAVLDHKIPDRVPVGLHNFLMACAMSGGNFRDTLRDGEALADMQLAAWREFGHDMILLENGTACNAQACGATVTYMDNSAPVSHTELLKELQDVLEDMLRGLGAHLTPLDAPFDPEPAAPAHEHHGHDHGG